MAEYEPVNNDISADILVVGGGIAGMTASIEAAEVGKQVILAEKLPSLGGRVISSTKYFPKLCPPTCGFEINLKRIRVNKNVRVLTLAEVEEVTGGPGNYDVKIRLNPGFVNDGYRREILYNGTFTSGGLPAFGYDPSQELESDEKRKKYDCPYSLCAKIALA